MTAVIYHGPPGSYKTFSVIQDVIIPELMKGRVVVTNIRGLDSIDRIEDALGVDIPPESEILSVSHDRQGFRDLANFFHWAPLGALIVMDEGQRVYPTRLRSLSEFDYPGGLEAADQAQRPATLENAFDQHRHYNWDIYITTPAIDKIHKEIRSVCEYGYRHRDMKGFLPWWRNRFKEIRHDPTNNGTSQSHAIEDPKIRKADTRIFDCYQSTATGVAKDSTESKSILKNPKLLAIFGVVVLAVGLFAKSAYDWTQIDRTKYLETTQTATDPNSGLSGSVVRNDQRPTGDSPLTRLLSQYKLRFMGYHQTGLDMVSHFILTDLDTAKSFRMTSRNLSALKISVLYTGSCLVKLKDEIRQELITCT